MRAKFISDINENKELDKLTFIKDYSQKFYEYIENNINKILKQIWIDGYYNFKINDLNISLTFDDIGSFASHSSEDGLHHTITVSFFHIFSNYFSGIEDVEQLNNIDVNTKKEINRNLKFILLTPYKGNNFIQRTHKNLIQSFNHEVAHHYDILHYGEKMLQKANRDILNYIDIEDKKEREHAYANSAHEINAYFLAALRSLIDNHGTKFEDFEIFIEMLIPYIHNWYHLNKESKKRIYRRAFNFYKNELQNI